LTTNVGTLSTPRRRAALSSPINSPVPSLSAKQFLEVIEIETALQSDPLQHSDIANILLIDEVSAE
jgi:hypothetical protein